MKISHTFGTFIKEKRQQRDISLRKFADQIGISPVYLSNLENDRMPAPKDEVVSTMARLLLLNDTDTAIDEIFKFIPALLEDGFALQGEADRLRNLRKP